MHPYQQPKNISLTVKWTPDGPVLVDKYTGALVENCTGFSVRVEAGHQRLVTIDAGFIDMQSNSKNKDNENDGIVHPY